MPGREDRFNREVEGSNVPGILKTGALPAPRDDLPINAIQLCSGYKAELFLSRPALQRGPSASHRVYLSRGGDQATEPCDRVGDAISPGEGACPAVQGIERIPI